MVPAIPHTLCAEFEVLGTIELWRSAPVEKECQLKLMRSRNKSILELSLVALTLGPREKRERLHSVIADVEKWAIGLE